MKKHIFQKGQEHLQKELERVKNVNNSFARDSILEFGKYLNRQQKSARRQLFLIQKLRVMQRDVEGGIIPLTDEKVVKAIDWVLENYQETETINGFRTALKQFYRISVNNEVPGELIELLRYRKDRKYKLESSDLVTEDELELLIHNCYNSRDKALFSSIYDSGMRHGEILEIRNKHVIFDDEVDGGAKIIVPKTEKTSTRKVILPKNGISIPYLREWEKDHPRRNEP